MPKPIRNKNVKFKIRLENIDTHDKEYIKSLLPNHIKLSKHANEQLIKRGIKFDMDKALKGVNINNVIDIQVDNNNSVKFLIRYSYTKNYDMVLVLVSTGIVCTCWLNHKEDTHKTLKDKHLYTNDINKLKNVIGGF